jgi:16S rRNA (guanine(966)-N(2))-methyltransferase RsmD
MRIIAGTKKGMKLFAPPSRVSRPILDRVKESLFSVLYKYGAPEGKKCVDLFSGVGSMGLECISRGATQVVFVEKNKKILSMLEKNISKAEFEDKSTIARINAFKFADSVDFENEKFDLIFVDPPYALARRLDSKSRTRKLLEKLADNIYSDGIIVLRTEGCVKIPEEFDNLRIIEKRKWSSMNISILKPKQDE